MREWLVAEDSERRAAGTYMLAEVSLAVPLSLSLSQLGLVKALLELSAFGRGTED